MVNSTHVVQEACLLEASCRAWRHCQREAQPAFTIGPTCCCAKGLWCPCCDDAEFPIMQKGTQVGKFTRPKLTCGEWCESSCTPKLR